MLEVREFDAANYINDPLDAAEFLNAAIEEGGLAELPRALGTVARALGMTDIARKAGLGRESLYKALGETGNPTISTLEKVIKACGFEVHVSFTPAME